MLEAEKAGARLTIRLAAESAVPQSRAFLRRIHKDEAYCCRLLTGELQHLGSTPSDWAGDFYEKVLALNSEEERLALLKRGQAWVARKVAEMLPRIKDDHLHSQLKDMLVIHEENVAEMA